MDYNTELDLFLEDLHSKPKKQVVIPEEIVPEPIRVEPAAEDILNKALNKRREIKESSERRLERPVLNLGKQVINYDEVVEGLGLRLPSKPVKVEPPVVVPVIEEVEEVPEVPEVLVEEVITQLHEPEPQQSFVDMLSQSLSQFNQTHDKVARRKEENIYEQRFDGLEHQMRDLRRVILENTSMTHNALFSPGGGETRAYYMDDVNNQTLTEGSYLQWDGTQFVGRQTTSSVPPEVSSSIISLEDSVQLLWEKLVSVDERFESIPNSDGGFLKLEDSTITDGEPVPGVDWPQFFDEVADGDTTRFIVSIDPQRTVYALEGVPQPTVEVPRGDIIEFDISGLSQPELFGIFKNGVELEYGVERDDVIGLITVRTGQIPEEVTKFYYKDRQRKAMGWVVNITEPI